MIKSFGPWNASLLSAATFVLYFFTATVSSILSDFTWIRRLLTIWPLIFIFGILCAIWGFVVVLTRPYETPRARLIAGGFATLVLGLWLWVLGVLIHYLRHPSDA